MFEIKEGLKFINVDMGYLKALHEVCSEVRYRDKGYDNKPFIGVLVSNEDGNYVIPLSSAKDKHILSVLDVKKMIPVKEGLYQKINLNPQDDDSEEEKKYKDLLNKEYSFCLKIMDDVIDKANKVYEKQIKSGKVQKFCCDFKVLEEICCTYEA